MPIADFFRGNTREYRFEFLKPNPAYTGEPPLIDVTAAGDSDYDHITAPLDISSSGVVSQTWTLTFVNATEYTISGSTLGAVGEGNTSVDAHPNNPLTNTPYFTLPASGWVENKIFAAADTLVFSTIAVFISEDITLLEITLTFIEEGAAVPIVTTTSVAGDHPNDDPVNGIMIVRLESGDSADLIEEKYIYGFERRQPDLTGPDIDLDDVRTIDVGSVRILTPAKVITP